eukprot:gb/GFBE01066005.1/.p1 GENE.gb/GFBE01066005.1/~~gb/GFBE01066005.1/.p1  ORF type:complete len:416 (+),score=84.81 gb/GFBE01066005.1/:1-1248(+)
MAVSRVLSVLWCAVWLPPAPANHIRSEHRSHKQPHAHRSHKRHSHKKSVEVSANGILGEDSQPKAHHKLKPTLQGSKPAGLVVMADHEFQSRYAPQIQTVKCFAQKQGYDLWLLTGEEFPKCSQYEEKQDGFFYLKHCSVAELLELQRPKYAAVVLDADVAAVVMNRSLDRWLDSDGDLQFYERITGEEVMAGNYVAKNKPWVRDFLHRWAAMFKDKPPGFSSADNGVLHVMLVEALELKGADHILRLYENLTAPVTNLDPYWAFVKDAKEVLGPPRAWRIDGTKLGRAHGCKSCVLAIWPRMNYFVDDGVYLDRHASSEIGPVMHHGIKDVKDVEQHYFMDVWSCKLNEAKVLVSSSALGKTAFGVAVGYKNLYPQGPSCTGHQCAERCVKDFTCQPIGDDDEPLMRGALVGSQ